MAMGRGDKSGGGRGKGSRGRGKGSRGRRWKGGGTFTRGGTGRDVSTPANLVFDTQRLGFFWLLLSGGGWDWIWGWILGGGGQLGPGRAVRGMSGWAFLRGRCSAVPAPFLFLAVSWDFEALDPPFFRMNVIQCLRSLGTARRGSLCWGWAGGLAGWLGTSVAQRGSENGRGGGVALLLLYFSVGINGEIMFSHKTERRMDEVCTRGVLNFGSVRSSRDGINLQGRRTDSS